MIDTNVIIISDVIVTSSWSTLSSLSSSSSSHHGNFHHVTPMYVQYNCITIFKPLCVGVTKCHMVSPWALELHLALFGKRSASTLCQGDTLWCVHNMSGISLFRWTRHPAQHHIVYMTHGVLHFLLRSWNWLSVFFSVCFFFRISRPTYRCFISSFLSRKQISAKNGQRTPSNEKRPWNVPGRGTGKLRVKNHHNNSAVNTGGWLCWHVKYYHYF